MTLTNWRICFPRNSLVIAARVTNMRKGWGGGKEAGRGQHHFKLEGLKDNEHILVKPEDTHSSITETTSISSI